MSLGKYLGKYLGKDLGKDFVKRSAVHSRNTRGCNDFVTPRCRFSMGQIFLSGSTGMEWHTKNYCDLKLCESLCIFTFFLFSESGLYLLNGFDFYFEWRDTENQQ